MQQIIDHFRQRRSKEGESRMTNNYRVVVHFDGTEYYGWQFQTAEYPTIQAELIRVLKIIAKKQVLVTGSSQDRRRRPFQRPDRQLPPAGRHRARFPETGPEFPAAQGHPHHGMRAHGQVVQRPLRSRQQDLRLPDIHRPGAVAVQPALRPACPFPAGRESHAQGRPAFRRHQGFYLVQLRRTGQKKDPRSGHLQDAGQERGDHLHRARQKLPALHGAQHGRHPDRRRPGKVRRRTTSRPFSPPRTAAGPGRPPRPRG